jgi:hypothetical protein
MNFNLKRVFLIVSFFFILFPYCLAEVVKDPAPMIYGEISEKDFNFNISDYPEFDSSANAVILCDYGQEFYSEYNNSYQTRTVRHRRILILKKSGIDLANVDIWFRSEDKVNKINKLLSSAGKYGSFWSNSTGEGIFKIKASSYNLDENANILTNEIDGNSVFVCDAAELVGHNKLSFAISDVNVGTIIEYTYTLVSPKFKFTRRWTFQHSLPCLHSEFRMAYDEIDTYAVIRNGLLRKSIEPVESQLTTKQFRKFKQKIHKFELENIPGMSEQNYISSMNNYRANIIIQLQRYWNRNINAYKTVISTWEELAKEYVKDADYGKQLSRHNKLFKEIKAQLPSATNANDKIELCYNFVRDYFNWNYEHFNKEKRNLGEVYESRYASEKEINLFLIRLLREYEIDAKMAFVSTRDHGWINENYPFVLQFNSLIGTVEVEGKYYFLNATDKQRPFNLTPRNIISAKAFILDAENPKLVTINADITFDQMLVLTAKIDGDRIYGKVQGRTKGYAAYLQRTQFNEDTLEFSRKYLFNDINNLELNGQNVINFDNKEKPIKSLVEFSCSDAVQYIDSLMIIEPFGLLQDIIKPLNDEKRDFPVELNFPVVCQKMFTITIPDFYEMEEIPNPQKISMDDGTASCTISYQKVNNLLQVKIAYRSSRIMFPQDKYENLREIFKMWDNFKTQPLVFVKK